MLVIVLIRPHHPKIQKRGGTPSTLCAAHPVRSPGLYLTPWYIFPILYFRIKIQTSLFHLFGLFGLWYFFPILYFSYSTGCLPGTYPPSPISFFQLRVPHRFSKHPPSLFILGSHCPLYIFLLHSAHPFFPKCHDST